MGNHAPWTHRYAILPLRLVMGVGFLMHGLAKWNHGPHHFAQLLGQLGMPFPLPTAWMVTLLEIGGGIALLAGTFVTVVCVPLMASMIVAMFAVHLRYGFSSVNTIGLTPQGPLFGPPGYEINLLYVAGLLALLLNKPAVLSLDHWFHRRRQPRCHELECAGPIRR